MNLKSILKILIAVIIIILILVFVFNLLFKQRIEGGDKEQIKR